MKQRLHFRERFASALFRVTLLAVLLFGVIMTVSCAYISVEQFLRMRGNDLYFI